MVGFPGLASAAYDPGRFADEHLVTGKAPYPLVEHIPTAIDPTPETIEGMARPSDASRSALATLEDNLTGRQVLDGPYVELPLTAWLNAGMEDELNRERARGSRILNELSPDSSTWVAEPDLTSSAAADLWQSGVRHLVLRPGSFASVPASEEEPTPARPVRIASPIDSPLDAVAIDSGLQAAFGRQNDPELTVTQILAELSVIQGEAPTAARGVLLAAPPAWPVSTTFLEALLRGLDDHPLVAASTLEDLFREVAPARSAAGAPLVRRLTPALPPDVGTYPAAMDELRQMVNSYGSMVGSDDPILGQWDQRLLLSGYLRLTTAERTAYLSGIRQVIETDVAAIEAPARQTVTLTAREGNIPLTLRSRLDRPVRVVLALQSNSRLEYPDRVELMLEPGSQQVQIRVRARSPGDTPLTVRVLSPDSGIDLTETRITVRSTAVSGIGYVLSGGAALFLVVWWGRHWRRDRRARRIAHHPSSENPKPT